MLLFYLLYLLFLTCSFHMVPLFEDVSSWMPGTVLASPFLSYVCCEGQCRVRQVVYPFVSSFSSSARWDEYFIIFCVLPLSLADEWCFDCSVPVRFNQPFSVARKSSSVLTLHPCLPLGVRLLATVKLRHIAVSFLPCRICTALRCRMLLFFFFFFLGISGPPSSI